MAIEARYLHEMHAVRQPVMRCLKSMPRMANKMSLKVCLKKSLMVRATGRINTTGRWYLLLKVSVEVRMAVIEVGRMNKTLRRLRMLMEGEKVSAMAMAMV